MNIKGIGINAVTVEANAIRITTEQATARILGHENPQLERPMIGSEAYLSAMEEMENCRCRRCQIRVDGPIRLGTDDGWVDGDYQRAEIFPPALTFGAPECDPACPWGVLGYALGEPWPEAVAWLALWDRPVFIDGHEHPEFHAAHQAAGGLGLFQTEAA